MIVTERGDKFLLFTQPDHAALAGALMALWRRDGLPDHPRRRELLLAIREHDNGWREADAAPRTDSASGRPLTFHDVAPTDRLAIWKRGTQRYAADHPFTALLILRHAIEIHRSYWSSAGWKEFGEELAKLEEELLGTFGAARSMVDKDYKLLELADTLSLGACGALGEHHSGEASSGYRFVLQLGRIALTPFPLAGPTTLTVAYRTLTKKPFQKAASLSAELAAATWQRLPVHIGPLSA
jgi:hypothetical protein